MPARCPVLVEGDSLAYLAEHRRSGPAADPVIELGAVGHGPQRAELAARLVRQVRGWAADRVAVPWVEAWPGDRLPDRPVTGLRVIPRPGANLVLGY